MSTNNAEGFNFKIVSMGRDEVDGRKPSNLKILTLAKLLEWIEQKNLDSAVQEELKKMASKYPHQALRAWQKNYPKNLQKAQKIVRERFTPKEKHEESQDN